MTEVKITTNEGATFFCTKKRVEATLLHIKKSGLTVNEVLDHIDDSVDYSKKDNPHKFDSIYGDIYDNYFC